MLEDEVPAAARGLMRSGLGKPVVVFMKPLIAAASEVDIDYIEATNRARRHSD
jgi:hypothetical protein